MHFRGTGGRLEGAPATPEPRTNINGWAPSPPTYQSSLPCPLLSLPPTPPPFPPFTPLRYFWPIEMLAQWVLGGSPTEEKEGAAAAAPKLSKQASCGSSKASTAVATAAEVLADLRRLARLLKQAAQLLAEPSGSLDDVIQPGRSPLRAEPELPQSLAPQELDATPALSHSEASELMTSPVLHLRASGLHDDNEEAESSAAVLVACTAPRGCPQQQQQQQQEQCSGGSALPCSAGEQAGGGGESAQLLPGLGGAAGEPEEMDSESEASSCNDTFRRDLFPGLFLIAEAACLDPDLTDQQRL